MIKKYLEYRKNRKIIKKEITKIATTILPVTREFIEKKADTINFINKLIDSTKNIDDKQLIEIVLKEISERLSTNQTRLIEILQYMSNLSPEDIEKILIHSMTETINTNKEIK